MTKHANIATGPATHPDAWIKAWKFAADAHREQKVKGSDLPYIFHVGAVMMELLAAHNALPIEDIDLAVTCAALHDCMEDQGVPIEVLQREFGPRAAAGVEALTKRAALPKQEAMTDSLDRIRQQPKAIGCVKLADRIVNLAPPPAHWSAAKITAYREDARVILAALGHAHEGLAARLEQKIRLYPAAA
ncbi:HD domain-containing protein [Ralstonia pseudosolanacearum]|uniref:HD domain-containing protein n=1 Tax=Ralstonia pseudosolanacearum TaxID=1310165 RepID=UPI000578738B|nr:HD domain-containing protein [Ralstonia pseudosolanacearum]ARS57763.1 guanosine-3',5'-bis(diphosphate) 3'-pyrophosphohydrolase [Ralstonia solanacearum FJAT-91]AXV67854.1 bifunctional (p)ppGpp synthetase/guanosine-3',5'-bis(diphosphate) 3'-pyrophosphohydrolase [Ralstonia solanacearum]AXV94128.1 bifunctional (p)ppGpp synthetase/guanosine-3',5'-bis(diphosphate) 3'-pyrophosphohydrolase [Ralstonia solanacearum]AXV99308.1 bifunctional (p)ppGpp synthetase/guanosine-3',5'-bis(diphosphate) 3'-pyropho